MNEHEIARAAGRLRDRLSELGGDAPQAQRRLEALGRAIEHLQSDLARSPQGEVPADGDGAEPPSAAGGDAAPPVP